MEFVTPNNSNLTFKVDLNAAGNIKQSGETAAKTKSFTFKYFATVVQPEEVELVLNNIASANTILSTIANIFGFTYNTTELSQTIARKVA